MLVIFEEKKLNKTGILALCFLLKTDDLRLSVSEIAREINMDRRPLYEQIKVLKDWRVIDKDNRSTITKEQQEKNGFEVVPALSHLCKLSPKALLLFFKLLFYRNSYGNLIHFKTNKPLNFRYFEKHFSIPYSELQRLTKQIKDAGLLKKEQRRSGYLWSISIPYSIYIK